MQKRPLTHHLEEFEKKYLRTGRSETTVQNAKDAVLFILRHTDLQTIEDCNDASRLEDELFRVMKERGFSRTTFNSYVKNLNTYFIWLERRSYIEVNNVRKVQRCKEDINEQDTFTSQQVAIIVGQINSRRQTRLERFRNTFFIDLLRFTGARPVEILNIRCQDIEAFKGGYRLKIHGKKQKGKPRYYRFESWLRDSYERYIAYKVRFRPQEPYLFISSSKQSRWTQKGMRGLFRKLSKEVGFRVTAYAFRRYVATTLYNRETPVEKIKNYLGHTRISTTYTYIQNSCCLTNDCADLMGSVGDLGISLTESSNE